MADMTLDEAISALRPWERVAEATKVVKEVLNTAYSAKSTLARFDKEKAEKEAALASVEKKLRTLEDALSIEEKRAADAISELRLQEDSVRKDYKLVLDSINKGLDENKASVEAETSRLRSNLEAVRANAEHSSKQLKLTHENEILTYAKEIEEYKTRLAKAKADYDEFLASLKK